MHPAKTILIVDDDQELRAGLRAVLNEKGYRTLEAEDGADARDMINGSRPDLVILDMMMPRWGGFAVLEHFQNHPKAPPFIMITANDGQKHRVYAEKIGVADYICKPFSLERLLEGVAKCLPNGETAKKEEPPGIRIVCGGCGARIKASVNMLGQMRPCPRCGRLLQVQPAPPEDEGPKMVM
jgi:DNA-binding response OmpR family regulator